MIGSNKTNINYRRHSKPYIYPTNSDTTRSYICPMKQLKQNIKFYLTQQTLTL